MNEMWLRMAHRIRALLEGRRDDEEGQGLVEYALILALIATFVIVALHYLQPVLNNNLNNVANSI